MAGTDKARRIAAAQLIATPERVAIWDKHAAAMGMSRGEFIRYSVDNQCAQLEAQDAAEWRGIAMGILRWGVNPHWVGKDDGTVIYDESEDGPAPDPGECPVCLLPGCGGLRTCNSMLAEKAAWQRAATKDADNPDWVAGCNKVAGALTDMVDARRVG